MFFRRGLRAVIAVLSLASASLVFAQSERGTISGTIRDSSGAVVGKIKADKNSWALGGGVAAAQNPVMFMNGAAEKIAEETVKLAK